MDDIHLWFSKNSKILILRDITYTTYKSDFRKYMEKVEESNYVLTLVSHDFLISKNCMHEVCLTLNQNENFEIAIEKILPVKIEGTTIKSLKNALDYEQFWKRQYVEAIDMLKEAIPNPDLLEELKIIQTIYTRVRKFVTYLQITDLAKWTTDENRNNDELNRILFYINKDA